MRVLFTVSSWATHYAAMVPLGWAMQAAAHDVQVLCTPSQATPLANAGLTPVPILDTPEDDVRLRLQAFHEARAGLWPYPWMPLHPLTGAPMDTLDDFDIAEYQERHAPVYAARAAASFDTAVGYARRWRPDLVLHDPANLEGLLAGRVLGIPTALCLWGPVGPAEPQHMRIVPEDISGSFDRYGAGPLVLDDIPTVIDACPADVAAPTSARRLTVRYVPYNGNGTAPEWVLDRPDRPRVCITWSTALASMSGPRSYLLPHLVKAVADLDVEVVLTATAEDVAALGSVPPSVRVLERMPLRLVLPSCAAVIHHGGSGSLLTAMWAGTPQLTVTFASEQTVAAQRVARTGASINMLGHEADVPSVRAAVDKILADRQHRDAARRLREELHDRPTPAQLVETLTDLSDVS